MDPEDFIDNIYLALLESNWTMNEIDSMDIIYYLKLLGKKAERDKKYIDDIL
ncbi:hypothetical protein NE686_03760 [Tissierella carlieri]|uniref:Uncharacterized protein n=1 Tax=Tissierella carlieri TaxID=689904 RepID=A0ABT1S6V2_9FIRM|nr:hypothetical protein [Tissierella carlieri]MCQ4922186.1 hypothetical protein [Tissierella carlieri]